MASTDQILSSFQNLKTLSSIALRILALAADEDAGIKDFEEVVRLDPVLTSRILKAVNSTHFGLVEKVPDIGRALVFIGIKNLRNLVLVDSLRESFKEDTENNGFSRKGLWMHSRGIGVCSQFIVRRLRGDSGEDAFLSGLLHDFGMIVEDQVEHDSFLQAIDRYRNSEESILDCEQQTMGTNHCNIGGMLALEWQFPRIIQELIQNHHRKIQDLQGMNGMLSVVQVAHYLINGMGYPSIEGKAEEPTGLLAEHIRENATEYTILAEELPEEMEKAKEFYGMD